MNTPKPLALIVVATPNPASFSHAMADAAAGVLTAEGYSLAVHDLYAEHFNPVQPVGEAHNHASEDALVEAHCDELARARLILICHPNWWGQPPAILKGWIDRVFRPGTAYAYPPGVDYDGVPVGMLPARHALIFNTSNTPGQREQEVFGDPLDVLWKRCVFGLCGVDSVERRMYGPLACSTIDERLGWLDEVKALVGRLARDAHPPR